MYGTLSYFFSLLYTKIVWRQCFAFLLFGDALKLELRIGNWNVEAKREVQNWGVLGNLSTWQQFRSNLTFFLILPSFMMMQCNSHDTSRNLVLYFHCFAPPYFKVEQSILYQLFKSHQLSPFHSIGSYYAH